MGKANRKNTFKAVEDDHSLQGKHGKTHAVC